MLESRIYHSVAEAVRELYAIQIDTNTITLQKTRKEFEGEFTVAIFPFVKASRKSPEVTANEIGNYLKINLDEIEDFNVIKGFLNLQIKNNYWLNFLKQNNYEKFGFKELNENMPVLIEYSSPNTNKPLHLGHIRNNLLGWSVAEILKANGKKVFKVNLVNDRGIHICKSMLAWQKWGKGETPESSGLKGDHLVGKYYVLFDKKLKLEVAELLNNAIQNICKELIANNYDENIIQDKLNGICFPDTKEDKLLLTQIVKNEFVKIKGQTSSNISQIPHEQEKLFIEKLKNNSQLLKEAQEMLRKWEAKDQHTIDLWLKMNGWVYKGFEVTYQRLGVDFDKTYYESSTYLLGKNIVEKGLQDNILIKKEDQSVWADLTDNGLDEKLLLRSDGTSVYMTQDLGTAELRNHEFEPLQMIYVVGNEQNYHFDVLKLVLKKLGYSWAENIYHLSYGMVELPAGKMKSREGTVVDADDLITEMENTAYDKALELGKIEDFESDEARKLYYTIAMGALKYFILKVDPQKNMLFNPEESIDFNGNTGPFIQYTHARIKSLLRKADWNGSLLINNNINILSKEKDIIRILHEYPAIIKNAGENRSPAMIANFAFELAKEFNGFYQEIPIFKEETEDLRNFRLSLSAFTAQVIKSSMGLLGIDVPEKM